MSVLPETPERVDAFLRRESIWAHLCNLFRHRRPDDDELAQISTIAEVAIDRVFEAYQLTPAQQLQRHGAVKDFAEASALYGYQIGYWMGQQAHANTPPPAPPAPPI